MTPFDSNPEGLRHLASIYAVLSATNEAILRAETPSGLYQAVCDAAIDGGKFTTAAVLVPDSETGWLKTVAAAGMRREQIGGDSGISVDEATAEGRGLAGTAYRNGMPCISNDFVDDPRSLPWRAVVRASRIAAGAAVPVALENGARGVLMFYSSEKDAFDDEAVSLIERLARNITFALGAFARDELRRQAEEALRTSEERYRAILENMDDAYYEVDTTGRHTFFNNAFPRLFGYTNEEIRATSNRDYQTPEMAAEVAKTFKEVYRTGISQKSQYWRYVHKNGSIIHVEGSVQLARDKNGVATGFRGILRDVTARRQTEQALRESEKKYRSILETIQDAYYEVDLQGRIVMCNGAFCRMLGYAESELLDSHYREYQTPKVAEKVFRTFNTVYRTGVAAPNFDWEMITKDGRTVVGEGSVQLFHGSDGKPAGFRGILRDVTERRKVERALRESEARFRALTNLSSDWYWEQDAEFRYVIMESRRKTSESTQGTFVGKRPWETELEIESGGGWDAHRDLLAAKQPFRDVIMHRLLPNGKPYYISVSGEPVFDGENRFNGYRGVSREITDQKVAEERIQHLATHDGLTGLPNRIMFSHLLSHAIPTAQRYGRSFAVLFIDLDRFKFINDSLGHEAGDKLLKEISSRFKKALRASDVVARLGGDEFVVLVQEMNDMEQAAAVARKLLSAAIKPMMLLGRECRVTASVGVAMYPNDGNDEQTLMKNADIAMYFAKEEGKNNFQFYSKDIKSQSLERLALEANLRHALERNEFSLHYQAKRDLTSGAITGVEALLRWDNAELGSVTPVQFIPVAEETGLIVPIGKWVLETACAQNVEWQRQGLPPVCMAVNLSVRQFADEHLLEDLAAILRETGMQPHLLELEITEGMVIHNPAQAIKLLTAIKNMGIRLAIDDFGTGYSSLGQLKNFPIDTLKVDRSFIRDIGSSSDDRAITEAIIAMGKTLSLTVVAEGVETMEQEAFLRMHACDEMQGYYFSKPIAAGEFATLLREHVANAK
ncbi:bifunctional diguanylate cyclase/phosphodiesterase [Noviherbaspirillum sp.]|uniref:bifunctional diguanylate cyclase/phosphodiesterase n=1 Tax=Noviherbaspirillum sp. TaxID=1926288 RepID=UPI002FE41974